MIGYKAFENDWTCRGKQYKVGESYHEDNVELCKHGMHFCTELSNVFDYYDYSPNMKLAKVEASGTTIGNKEDSKHVTSDLKVLEEIDLDSEAVKLAAVRQDWLSIKYIDNPSKKVQLEAVKEYGYAICYITNPSEEVQLASVKQNSLAIWYIDSPSEEAKKLYKKTLASVR